MVRLYFRRGPFDGGAADFDHEETRHKSRKARANGEVRFPPRAFVAIGDGAAYVWAYRLARTLGTHSAEYVVAGWMKVSTIPRDSAIVLI